jgi:hypothetical protein
MGEARARCGHRQEVERGGRMGQSYGQCGNAPRRRHSQEQGSCQRARARELATGERNARPLATAQGARRCQEARGQRALRHGWRIRVGQSDGHRRAELHVGSEVKICRLERSEVGCVCSSGSDARKACSPVRRADPWRWGGGRLGPELGGRGGTGGGGLSSAWGKTGMRIRGLKNYSVCGSHY